MLDLIRLLNDEDIYYEQSTVDQMQLKIDCPECGGIGKLWVCINKELYYCHRCQWVPSDVEIFVKMLTGKRGIPLLRCLKEYQFTDGIDKFEDKLLEGLKELSRVAPDRASASVSKGPLEFPEHCIHIHDPDQYRNDKRSRVFFEYLTKSRGFSWNQVKDLGFRGCYKGKYYGRLIIPVFYRGDLVFWQAREVLGRQNSLRYLTPSGYSSNRCLFNIENASEYEYTMICEGFFSSLRTGDDSVATFGNKISKDQIELLINHGVKNVILCFDPDSWRIPEAVKKRGGRRRKPAIYNAAVKLLGRFDDFRITILDKKDPDDLGYDLMREKINDSIGIYSELDLINIIKEHGEL